MERIKCGVSHKNTWIVKTKGSKKEVIHEWENPDLNFEIFYDLSYDHYAAFTYFAPILKLNARLVNIQSAVAGSDMKPTQQCYENYEVLSAELDIHFAELKEIMEKDIPELNRFLSEQGVPAIPVQKIKEEKL